MCVLEGVLDCVLEGVLECVLEDLLVCALVCALRGCASTCIRVCELKGMLVGRGGGVYRVGSMEC